MQKLYSVFSQVMLKEFYKNSGENIQPAPDSIFLFNHYMNQKDDENIFDLNKYIKEQFHSSWNIFTYFEKFFFKFLELENIVRVDRNQKKLTPEQNEQIDLHCYCNVLKAAAQQGLFKIPYGNNLPSLPNTFKGKKFSCVIHFLEKQQTGWAFLATAFLLANIIETHVDLSEKTDAGIKEYWSKRLHDAISFSEKAIEFDPAIKPSVDMLLLHIKVASEESYPDIKQRINTLFLEPDIETLSRYERDSVQALLQYKKNLFIIKLEKTEKPNPQENNQIDVEHYFSLTN